MAKASDCLWIVCLENRGFPRTVSQVAENLPGKWNSRGGQEAEADYRQIRRDWCLGDEDFRNELITSAVERVGPSHHSARRQETGQEKAERIVRDELKRRGWEEQDLPDQPKGAKAKVAMARRLRKETTMTLKWIAARLEMGSWTYMSNLLNAGNKNAKLTLCQ